MYKEEIIGNVPKGPGDPDIEMTAVVFLQQIEHITTLKVYLIGGGI